MGCGASTSKGGAGGAVDAQPPSSQPSEARAVLTQMKDMASTNMDDIPERVAEYGSKALETIQSLDFGTIAANLSAIPEALVDWDASTAEQLVGIFDFAGDVLQTIAHVAIPPPGGQVIAAALAIAHMIIKASMNTKACIDLAKGTTALVKHIVENEKQLKSKPSIEEDLKAFQAVVERVQDFVKDVLEQGWAMKLLTWRKTQLTIDTCKKDLEEVKGMLTFGTQMAAFSILVNIEQEAKDFEEAARRIGSPEEIVNDPKKLQQLVDSGALRSKDAIGLKLQGKTLEAILDLKKNLKEDVKQAQREVAQESWPHNHIKNPLLQSFWKKSFKNREAVPWQEFFAFFPQALDEDSIKVELIQELSADGDKAVFKSMVESDGAEAEITAFELNLAFPDQEANVLDRIRALKEDFKSQRVKANTIPLVPTYFKGRATEVAALQEILRDPTQRLAVLVGGPGEGKQTVAGKVAHEMLAQDELPGGARYINLADVTNEGELKTKIVQGLIKVPKQMEASEAISKELQLLAATNQPVLFLITHCEDALKGENKSTREELVKQVQRMLEAVPQLTIILTSRVTLASTFKDGGVVIDTGKGPTTVPYKEVAMELFLNEDAEAVLMHIIGSGLSRGDASHIVQNFGSNPLLMVMVAKLIQDKTITVADAMEHSAANDLLEDGGLMEEYKAVKTSVLKSLDLLEDEKRKLLLLLSLYGGAFEMELVTAVVGSVVKTTPVKLKLALKDLGDKSLIKTNADGTFVLPAMVRDIARLLLKDAKALDKYGLSSDQVMTVHKKYLDEQAKRVAKQFRQYLSSPSGSYTATFQQREHVQQVLRIVSDSELGPELVESSGAAFIKLLRLLPYIQAYDKMTVQVGCNKLAELMGESVDKGCCKAVAALFYELNQTAYKASLEMAEEAIDALSDSDDGKAKLYLAMAYRAKGLVLREMFDLDKSIKAFKDGLKAIKPIAEEGDQEQLERILLQAELAGTLDWVGKPEAYEEGEVAAREAIKLAEAMLEKESNHPILAMCYTYLGYFLKAKGEHEEAIKLHIKAYEMRCSSLTKTHPETAISLQQRAISEQALKRYAEAEELYKQSLDIRIKCLGVYSPLVANTYEQLANLYKEMKQEVAAEMDEWRSAERNLRKALSIRSATLSKTGKKTIATAKSLVVLLRDNGMDDRASELEKEFNVS